MEDDQKEKAKSFNNDYFEPLVDTWEDDSLPSGMTDISANIEMKKYKY